MVDMKFFFETPIGDLSGGYFMNKANDFIMIGSSICDLNSELLMHTDKNHILETFKAEGLLIRRPERFTRGPAAHRAEELLTRGPDMAFRGDGDVSDSNFMQLFHLRSEVFLSGLGRGHISSHLQKSRRLLSR